MPSGLWIGDAYAHGPGECAPEYAGLWEGLVGCWVPALGPTGNVLLDVSGYGNHGTLTNMDTATDWVPGKDGWGLEFDSTNEYVAIPYATHLDLTSTQYLSTMVAFAGSANSQGLIGNFTSPTANWWYLGFYSASMLFMEGVGTKYRGVRGPWLSAIGSTWHAAVGTINGPGGSTLMRLYIDGYPFPYMNYQNDVCAAASSTVAYAVGARGITSWPYAGSIACAAIWSRTLHSTEACVVSSDPLCFLRPRRRWWAVAPAAAGVYRVRRYHDRLFAPGLSPGVM